MSVVDVVGASEEKLLNDLYPESYDVKLTGFAEDKAKVFFEAFANISFYLGKLPKFSLFGSQYNPESFVEAEKGFKNAKTILSLPNAARGAFSLYETFSKGKAEFKKTLTDVCFFVGDSIDSIKGLKEYGVVTSVSKSTFEVLDRVKNLAGFIGISKSIEDNIVELNNLKKIDPSKIGAAPVKNREVAKEIKKRWVVSEIKTKQCDLLKNITGLALVALSMTIGYLPWTFALLGSVSVGGKVMNYMHKNDASFWHKKYAETLK